MTEDFSPASVTPNSASTLTVTIANANGFALTQSSLQVDAAAGAHAGHGTRAGDHLHGRGPLADEDLDGRLLERSERRG